MKNEEIKKYVEINDNFYYVSNRFYYKFAKQYDMSDMALYTLEEIYRNDKKCIQNDLADKLALPKQTVCSILDSFEKKGYIKREINPKDKRNRFVNLTKNVWNIEDETGLKGIERTIEYFKEINMPTNFTELKIGIQSEEIINELTDRATKNGI